MAGLNVKPMSLRATGAGVFVDQVRAASFRILYDVHGGPEPEDELAIRAWTRMAVAADGEQCEQDEQCRQDDVRKVSAVFFSSR